MLTHWMTCPTEGIAMIFAQELQTLNSQLHHQVEELVELVRTAAQDGHRIDTVERNLFAAVLALGRSLLEAFVQQQGDGDCGPTVETPDGRTLQKLPEPHTKRYLSLFGEILIERAVYAGRQGKKIERAPLDERLGLPESDFSYVVEDFAQRLCLNDSFDGAGQSLAHLFGLKLGSRTLEQMNRTIAADAVAFQRTVEPPPQKEEGPILVVAADGKGVPMRRSERPKPHHRRTKGKNKTKVPRRHHRRTKGEKANKKRMATVAAIYSIDPFVRNASEVLDEVLRNRRAAARPVPKHKHVWAEMTRELDDGVPAQGKDLLFCWALDEVERRRIDSQPTLVCLMDGERALWSAAEVYFPEAVGILDIYHVLERLWTAAHCFHSEGSVEAEQFVSVRFRDLLLGRVGQVINELRRRQGQEGLSAARRRTLAAVVEYLENNRSHMKYDEYLAAGYPIGSGAAEGACRHLVKDRLERTGMHWTVAGAQAMLQVRATCLNGQWSEFLEFRIEREQERLYGRRAA